MTLRTFRKASRWSPHARATALLLAISLLPWYGVPTSVQAQAVPVPNLNPPAFQSTDLNPYFNAARNAGSQAGWEAIVADARTVMLASWEAAVDAQIQSAVSGVSESDAFNSIAAYQDYLRQALTLQRQEALSNWQLALEASVQLERAGFIDQLSRRTQQETSDESNRDLRNESSNPSSDADRAREEWERDFDANLEKGLADYQNALTGLFDDYNAVLLDIQQKDQEFATNKQRIDQYEQIVRDAIDQATTQLEQMLTSSGMFHAETCTAQNVCTTDPNTYNADGQALNDLITQLRNGLQANARLSVLAQQITTYLQQQEQRAEQREQFWQARLRGTANYNTSVDLSGYLINGGSRTREVHYIADHAASWADGWGWGATPTSAIAQYFYDINGLSTRNDIGGIVEFTTSGSVTRLSNLYASTGEYRTVESIISAAFIGPGVQSNWGSVEGYATPQYNTLLELFHLEDIGGPNCAPPLPWQPGCVHRWHLRAAPNVSIVSSYNWFDPNADHNRSTWAGYKGSVGGVANSWANDVLDSIRAWEDQTDAFDADYAIFQGEAAAAQAQAEQALLSGQEDLIRSRSAWLDQMSALKKRGENSWDALNASADAAAVSALSQTLASSAQNDATQIASAASASLPRESLQFLSRDITAPDETHLNSILNAIPKTFTGISNLAFASAQDSEAILAQQQVLQSAAAIIGSQQASIAEHQWQTEITADGQVVGRRQVHTGNAVQKAGTDGTDSSHYDATFEQQTLSFEGTSAVRLASAGDLFSDWNYEEMQDEFLASQDKFQREAELRLTNLDGNLKQADRVAQQRAELFEKRMEQQMESAQFTKALIEGIAQGMLGGASFAQAATSTIQGQFRSKIAGVFAEATGLPAGFISALLGGAKPQKAFMSYVEGEMWSTFETEMSKATGLPLNGVLSSLWQKREQKKQEAKQKKAAVVDTVMTVAAVVAAPFTGGASVAALAAVKAAQGAQKGGLKGAIAGAASAYANAAVQTFSGGTVSVDLSYSYENGFGAGVGVGIGPAKIGVSASERGGASISAGIGDVGGGTLGINMKYSKNGGFSAGVGYTNTASGVALGANYSPGAGLSGYASITTDRGGTAGAGSTSVGVGFSRSEGAGAFVQRGNAETGQGKVSFTQRDGLGVSVKNSFAEIGTSQRGGTTYAVNLKTGDGFGEAGVLPGANLGLKYNTNTGFSASLTGSTQIYRDSFGSTEMGYSLSYADGAGLSSSLNTTSVTRIGVSVTPGAPQITSLDELSSTASVITSQRQQKLEQDAMIADVRRDLGELGIALTPEYENELRENPEKLAQLVHEIGEHDVRTGQEHQTAGVGTTRESLWDSATGVFEDAYRGIVQGTISNDRGFIDPVTGEYRQRTCFVAGTLVAVPGGFKKVEEVRGGDFVLAQNERTGEMRYARVQHTFVRSADRIYQVRYADGTLIETTWSHPFFIRGKGWIQARLLQAGDVGVTARGAELAIEHVTIDSRYSTVYNFSVEEYNNYFVGESMVLVHNQQYENEKYSTPLDCGQRGGQRGGGAPCAVADRAAGFQLAKALFQNGRNSAASIAQSYARESLLLRFADLQSDEFRSGFANFGADDVVVEAVNDEATDEFSERLLTQVGLRGLAGRLIPILGLADKLDNPQSSSASALLQEAYSPPRSYLGVVVRPVGEVRIDPNPQRIRSISPAQANAGLGGGAPRFAANSEVIEFRTDRDQAVLYRLQGPDGQSSQVAYLRRDIFQDGRMLSPRDMRQRLGLSFTPAALSFVQLERGATVRVGRVGRRDVAAFQTQIVTGRQTESRPIPLDVLRQQANIGGQ